MVDYDSDNIGVITLYIICLFSYSVLRNFKKFHMSSQRNTSQHNFKAKKYNTFNNKMQAG